MSARKMVGLRRPAKAITLWAIGITLAWESGACAQSTTRLILSSGTGVPGHVGFVFGDCSSLAMNEAREIVFLSTLRSARTDLRAVVRSPTWSAEKLNQYSVQPWPKWDVPPGYLTLHGKKLMKIFGAYDRAYLAQAGLLSAAGCSDAGQVFILADSEEGTVESGRALAEGMFPGCAVKVHSQQQGKHDPLFSPFEAGIEPPDRELAVAAVSGRIGGNPAALEELYRPALKTMQQVLFDCKTGEPSPPASGLSKKSLFEEPTSLHPGKGDHAAELGGPIKTAATLSEDFLLEYANNMEGQELGWGRVNESDLREMMSLHAVSADLLRQTPIIARACASNLLSYIMRTMEQAAIGRPVRGALGKTGVRVLVLAGHDTNISNVAGALGLSWLI